MLKKIATEFAKHNIQCFFVGGCVRDEILGQPCDDIDICLVGVTRKEIVMEILSQFTEDIAEEVGNLFPVWIANIQGLGKIDFALARSEKKCGEGHRAFSVSTNSISITDDLLRRDLTINAIAKNVLTEEIVDPFGGLSDLMDRIARPVSAAFAEDELRVIRAARFISRFELTPDQSLIDLCKGLNPDTISNERIGQELKKVLIQGKNLNSFFSFLKEVNWLNQIFPELISMEFNLKSKTFGGRLFELFQNADIELMLNRIAFMDKQFVRTMKVISMTKETNIRKFVRVLIDNKIQFELLEEEMTSFNLNEISELISSGKMNPIVTGKKLIENGFKPSKELSAIIKKCTNLQDEGTLNEGNWKDFL